MKCIIFIFLFFYFLYFESNQFLRTLDKGHFIGLANAIKKLNGKLNFDGSEYNNKIYPIVDAIQKLDELKKFRKYFIY